MSTIPSHLAGVSTSPEVRELDSEWLFDRLAVRAPYFALGRCHSGAPGSAFATVERLTPPDFEDTPIAVAEAGRHLALLGSCAVATLGEMDSRHYVLARRATVRRGGAVRWASSSRGPLLASAHASVEGRRQASASTRLYDCRGDLIFDLQVEYQRIPGRMFERMNAAFRRRDCQEGPYERPEIEILDLDEGRVRARLPSVSVASCRGHFADFPMLPFDGLCSSIADAARPLLEPLAPGGRWQLREARLRVDRMVFAGSTVEIEVRRSAAEPTRLSAVACEPDGAVVAHAEAVWDRSPAVCADRTSSSSASRLGPGSTALAALFRFGLGRDR